MSPAMFLGALRTSSIMSDDRYPINEVLEKHLEEASSSMPEWNPSGCLLTDVASFLVQTSNLMSELANGLVSGEHLTDYENNIIEGEQKRNDGSDFALTDYFFKKEVWLRSMNKQIQSSALALRDVWSTAPSPPEGFIQNTQVDAVTNVSRLSLEQDHSDVSSDRRRSSTMTQVPRSDTYESSMELDEVMSSPGFTEAKQRLPGIGTIDLSSLNIRGKGNYTCPYAMNCRKGGVQGGELVQFRRNCAFKAHLQKHAKSFKCDIQGCPNKKGFARIDQLKRHQQTVRHESYS